MNSRRIGEDAAERDDSVQLELPEGVTIDHLDYLDALRESGATNMFGARPYVQREFGVDTKTASKICSYWMQTFSTRHPR